MKQLNYMNMQNLLHYVHQAKLIPVKHHWLQQESKYGPNFPVEINGT